MKFLSIPRENGLRSFINTSQIVSIDEYEDYVKIYMIGDSDPFMFESKFWACRSLIGDDSIAN